MTRIAVVDAHHHLCRLSSASYPWLEGEPQRRYHGDDVPLRRDYLLEDYLGDAGALRSLGAELVGSVHVENGAADPMGERDWVGGVIADHGIPTAQVVKVDLSAPDARARIAAHAARPDVRGVRDILNHHADPFFSHRDRDLTTDPDWRSGFSELERHGLSFDLQVFPHQLDAVAELAGAHPGIPIVLDHAAMPIDRSRAGLADWRTRLHRLARHANVAAKISALGTLDHGWSIASIRPIVLGVIDEFGPDRCMFASNFPVDGLYSTYGRLFEAFLELTDHFTASERADLFAGTAIRSYRLPAPSALVS